MEVLNFSDFQKEIQEIRIKNPKFNFDHRSVQIITIPYFFDIFNQILVWFVSIFLALNNSTLFFGVAVFIWTLYFFYTNFIGLGMCLVDFNTKTISFRNRIFLFNIVRRIFSIKQEVKFSDIKKVAYKKGSDLYLSRVSRGTARYYLLLETYKDPAIIISQFKKEEDAEKITSILRKFILHKEKIIA